MSHRTALVISTALTVIVLLTGIGLALRVADSQADPDVDVTADATQPPPDIDSLQQEYIDHLQTSNAALVASYDRIAALLDDVEQLKTQNAALLEREAVYEQRLAEANARLEQAGRLPVPTSVTTLADDASPAPAPESAGEAPAASNEPSPQAAAEIRVSPRLGLAPAETVTVSRLPPVTAPSSSRTQEIQTRTAPPTATGVTAKLPASSIFALAPLDPSEVVVARTPTASPLLPAAQPIPTNQPTALVASQPPPATRLMPAAQPTPTPTPAPLVASAKPSQAHDGDGDSDDRGGDGKGQRNDHRRR